MTWLRAAPYFAIAALLVIALYYRGESFSAEAERDKAVANLAIAKDANDTQSATIERLTAANARTDKILADISYKLAGINQGLVATNETIADLGVTDETIREYLGAGTPGELKRVLNRR